MKRNRRYWYIIDDQLYDVDEDPFETEEERQEAINDNLFILVEQDFITKEWNQV